MAVAEPLPEITSDLALNSGTAMSWPAPSSLIRLIWTTAPSGTFRSGLTTSAIAPVWPINTSLPPAMAVRSEIVTSGIMVTDVFAALVDAVAEGAAAAPWPAWPLWALLAATGIAAMAIVITKTHIFQSAFILHSPRLALTVNRYPLPKAATASHPPFYG